MGDSDVDPESAAGSHMLIWARGEGQSLVIEVFSADLIT